MRCFCPGPLAGLLLASLLLVAPAASVAGIAGRPTLVEAVDAAWRIAVEARHADSESRRAEAGMRVARSFAADSPALAWSREEGDWYGGARAGSATETEIGLSWPLWMPGQRRAAVDASRADAAWASANLAQARLEVAARVRETAWDIAARQAELGAAQSAVDALVELAGVVERRVAFGDLATSDLLASRAGVLDAEMARDDALRRLEAARARWTVLTGYEETVDAGEMEAETRIDSRSLLSRAGTPPSLVAAEASVRRAEGERAAVRRSLGAPPELTLGAKEESDGPGAMGDRSLVLALRIPLGFGARRELAQATAQSALDVAQAELSLARSKHAADLAAARSDFEITGRQLEGARQRAELLSRRQQMMERAFAAGEIPLAELLLAHRDSRAARADLARRKAERGLAHTSLLHAIGAFP